MLTYFNRISSGSLDFWKDMFKIGSSQSLNGYFKESSRKCKDLHWI